MVNFKPDNGSELSGAGPFYQFDYSAESGVRFSDLFCRTINPRTICPLGEE